MVPAASQVGGHRGARHPAGGTCLAVDPRAGEEERRMEVGLLWYDSDPKRALEDKIGPAVERYREKYGRWPNTCYVHPQIVGDQAGQESGLACRLHRPEAVIRVVSAPNVLLHHFWLGESVGQVAKKEPVAG